MSNKLLRTFCAAWMGLTYAACGTAEQQQPVDADELSTNAESKDDHADIQQALSVLPGASVQGSNKDGVPYYITGNFGFASSSAKGLAAVDAKATVQEALAAVAPVFRLQAANLTFKRVTVDQNGHQHLRFQQMKNGLPVINGELILHVDAKGNVYAANGDARDTKAGVAMNTLVKAQISADAAVTAATKSTQALNKSGKAERLVYVRDTNESLVLAHEIRVVGQQGGIPVEDLVYVNADNGKIALRAPKVYTSLNRAVYSANNGTSLPGTLKRSEGGAASGDNHVDTNYAKLGGTYNCYFNNFGRDSFNNAGAQLKSTVHYSTNYVNAYWNSSQMVYGDGDGVNSTQLGLDNDVTTHELTHAVTENESNLTYSGESGGINEGMSDIFGAFCESYESGSWITTDDVFKVGEDIWTPATPGDALRYMYDPAKDGASLDYWTSSAGSVDVHYSSGIANLAFTLLSRGGTHPRGKSTTVVTGIGVQKAGQIFYKANTDILTASSKYAALKTATEQAATQLGFTAAEIASVTAAWAAVGVGSTTPPTVVTLSNGVPVTGIGASAGTDKVYKLTVPASQTSVTFTTSGGTGDVDLYVKAGAIPDTSTYDCKSEGTATSETCTKASPAAGDWYVLLSAYATYSGVTLTGTYTGGTGGGTDTLTNGVATAQYSGSASTWKCWTLTVPSGKSTLTFNQVGASGNTGDADLYVRQGSAPTTSTYSCRPYLTGNTETCTISSPTAGTWYACSYGYSAYTKVTMKGTY
ncbi:M4 family metallopeptidase [Hyalangium versicolor]|uniref:M4 family metallopeptidase n=1 Tax=Hyalangium versicolor TaxID=2861190 RepID=UPI001CD00333|nr:M4 family metallopeptidase [Hyalangium versicolor]